MCSWARSRSSEITVAHSTTSALDAACDPDSLAEFDFDQVAGSLSFEGYPAQDAWFSVHGLTSRGGGGPKDARRRLDAFVAAATARHGEDFGFPHSYYDEPLWHDDAEQLRQRLPALSARFPDSLPPSP